MSFHSTCGEIESQLKALILDTANNNIAPKMGIIKTVSNDNCYADIAVNGGVLKAVECFGYPTEGSKVVVVFLEGTSGNPIALCNPISVRDYEDITENYNVLENGDFSMKKSDGTFINWTGGTQTNQDACYGTTSCILNNHESIISDVVDLSEIYDEYKIKNYFELTLVWKGGSISVTVLDTQNHPLSLYPQLLGNVQNLAEVSEWRFQRMNYSSPSNKKIKIKITNTDTKPTLLDGIRVWTPDDYQKWFPHKNDIKRVTGSAVESSSIQNDWIEHITRTATSTMTIHFNKKYKQLPMLNITFENSNYGRNTSYSFITETINNEKYYTGVTLTNEITQTNKKMTITIIGVI